MPHEARKLIESFGGVAREILRLAHEDLRRADFLHNVSTAILNFARCEAADIFLLEEGRYQRCATSARQPHDYELETIPPSETILTQTAEVASGEQKEYVAFCCSLLAGRIDCEATDSRLGRCFWTQRVNQPLPAVELSPRDQRSFDFVPISPYPSMALLPFELESNNCGLLVLKHTAERFFSHDNVALLQGVANLLGMPIIHRSTQLALRERIKELTCLYGIAKLAGTTDLPLPEILASVVDLLPPAWLYPEVASGRIVLDEQEYLSRDYRGGCDKLRANIVVDSSVRGFVEVAYADKRPDLVEGPFLREERHLIDVVARELSLIVDQHSAEQQREHLQEQLRHADRLATIGQLSAGVAHELNEPLGGILGFAQLAQKTPDLPAQVQRDLNRIVSASLHAREVIKKLLLFARQSDRGKDWVDLNMLVADGLYFLESRCAKAGVELVRDIQAELPEIAGDPGQIYQVLINLAVNAIQAMPDGGRLTISTALRSSMVELEVQDTGAGMSEELQRQIFLPFFTTKDVGEGTGLGLSVVEGIVAAHGGTISVESTKGVGTTFTVRLPTKGTDAS